MAASDHAAAEAAFEDVCEGIRSLRIQGATRIALQGMAAVAARLAAGGLDPAEAERRMLATRPNEPMMANLIARLLASEAPHADFPAIAARMHASVIAELDANADIGARLLTEKHVVMTHCHSTTVVRAITRAHAAGADLQVLATETRPRFQGRLTARDLVEAGVPTTQLVDSAALTALRRADLLLLGADAVLATGHVVNKVGSALLALAAERLEVPVYVVCHSLKFDPASCFGHEEPIEQRSPDEVWPTTADGTHPDATGQPHGDRPAALTVENPAFERVPAAQVTAFITEAGLLDLHELKDAAATWQPSPG